MNNFILTACDTDSLFFKKTNEDIFTKEEQERLNESLNSIFEEHIKWEPNGLYTKMVTLKAKNYILYDGKKVKYKGSSLKSSTLEIALKEFLQEIIQSILNDQTNYVEIYNKYIKEINNIQDIKRWASKKTISEKTLTSERANETKIMDAIKDSDYREGDKVYVYFKSDGSLSLIERFDGDYDKDAFYKKLYNTALRFETIMNCKELFLNYSLKRNKIKLEEVLK